MRPITLPFVENFSDVVTETSYPDNSDSNTWNVTSGAYLNIGKGTARTNSVALTSGKYFDAYKDNVDCEGGAHPENIFRVVSRDATLQDFTFSASFKITRVSKSTSPNRTPDKGISLMFHYVDESNVMYLSARHDGQISVKRKENGVYTTLAIVPAWFPGDYDRILHPTLLPVGTTFSLKVAVKSSGGVTSITAWVSDPGTTTYHQVLTTSDNAPALAVPGRVGIRSDFCSTEIDNISIT